MPQDSYVLNTPPKDAFYIKGQCFLGTLTNRCLKGEAKEGTEG